MTFFLYTSKNGQFWRRSHAYPPCAHFEDAYRMVYRAHETPYQWFILRTHTSSTGAIEEVIIAQSKEARF